LPQPPAAGDDFELNRNRGEIEHVQIDPVRPGSCPTILQPPQFLRDTIAPSQYGHVNVAGRVRASFDLRAKEVQRVDVTLGSRPVGQTARDVIGYKHFAGRVKLRCCSAHRKSPLFDAVRYET